ncbi:AaceriAER080Wp [[Ashbya] aceris (nom. inval.)]|nr:AaceriAER080Wp [[Ashbya] aceris (nom. inval.)]
MLRAELVNAVPCQGAQCIAVVDGVQQLVVVRNNRDFLVYSSVDEGGLRLVQTYTELLGPNYNVEELLYSERLRTIFVRTTKCFLLLHSSNLQHYDKIVDKRGIDRAWLFEHPCGKGDTWMTVLVYSVTGSSKIKMLTWVGRQFQAVHEVALGTRSEVLSSVSGGPACCVVLTSTTVYQWSYMSSELVRVDRVIKPTWPRELYDTVKEVEAAQVEASIQVKEYTDDVSSLISVDSLSQLSRKTNLSNFWFKKPQGRAFKDVRLAFLPSDSAYPVIMDGKTEMMLQLERADKETLYITVHDCRHFYERNKDFETVQYYMSRYLLLSNSNFVRIVDYYRGFIFMEIYVSKGIKCVYPVSESSLLIRTLDDELQLYRISCENDLTKTTVLDCRSIPNDTDEAHFDNLKKRLIFYESLLDTSKGLNMFSISECCDNSDKAELYALKLRDLGLLFAVKSFERFAASQTVNLSKKLDERVNRLQELLVKQLFDLFLAFLAPPELVLRRCLPYNIAAEIDDLLTPPILASEVKRTELSPKLINRWCLPYLTDIRRHLHNLQRQGPNATVIWTFGAYKLKVGIAFFQLDHSTTSGLLNLLRIIDTALFQLYMHYNKPMVGPLIRVDNNCDLVKVEAALKENQMFQELIDFYYNKSEHAKALNLLIHLSDYVDKSFTTNGMQDKVKNLVIDYLSKLPSEYLDTIFEYTAWLLKNYSDKDFIISSIFMNDSPACGKFNYEKVYSFIDKCSKQLSVTYLEYIVNIYHHTDSKIFNYLILRYIQDISNEKSARKLKAILKTTAYYEPRVVLRYLSTALEDENLTAENIKWLKLLKTWPLRRLGEHDTALGILIDDLGNYNQASVYCNELYTADKNSGTTVLMNLFEKLLAKVEFSGWRNVHLFLLENGSKLDAITLFEKLPSNIPINTLNEFLSRRIKSASMKKNQSRIQNNLLKVNLIGSTYRLSQVISEFVVIDEDNRCYICQKNLTLGSSELFSLFKLRGSNILTHYNCGRSLQEIIAADECKSGNMPHVRTLGDYKDEKKR